MGVLYASSRPSQHCGHDGGFGDGHESACPSMVPRYRRAHSFRAPSGLQHSFPLVICRVGLVHDAEKQRLLPGYAKQSKILEQSGKDRNKSDKISAVFATATVEGRSRTSDTGVRSHDNTSINQSRLGAKCGSPVSEGAADVQSKSRLLPAPFSEEEMKLHGTLLEEFIKFIGKEIINLFIKELIPNLIGTIIEDFMKDYVKAIFSAMVEVFVKHFSKVSSKDFIDDIFSGLDDELSTSNNFTDQPITESHQGEHKPSADPIKDEIDPAEVPLPPSPDLKPLKSRPRIGEIAAASVTNSFEKRPRDDSDENITELQICIKRARSRKNQFAISVQRRDDSIDLAVLAEAVDRPSNFDVSREGRNVDHNRPKLTYILGWSIFDWQSLTSATRDVQDTPLNAETSLSATKVQSADIGSAPQRLISIIQPALRQPNTSAKSFVSAIQKFNELIPGCDVVDRFRKQPDRCLANKKDGQRCNSRDRLSVEDQSIVGKLLPELARMNFDSFPLYCVQSLVTFINIAVCRCQRIKLLKEVAALRQLRQLERPYDTDLVKHLPVFLPFRLSDWAGLKVPPEWACLTVDELVLETARKPPEVDVKGYLYVYWNEATFGVRKIGFTTKEVSYRLKEWEEQCNHVATEQYRSPCKVRYADKVEQLVHADLLHYRVYEIRCRTCSKSHIEWFRGVDLPFIIERIEAWSQWVSEEPYKIVDGQWRLTPEAEDSIHMVRAPRNGPNAEGQSKSLANHPRRYNLRRVKGRKPGERGSPGP